MDPNIQHQSSPFPPFRGIGGTITDFKNNVGQRFRVVDGDGKYFHRNGLMGKQDVIRKVDEQTQMVEGDMFIAHYSLCRFIQDVPAGFKK